MEFKAIITKDDLWDYLESEFDWNKPNKEITKIELIDGKVIVSFELD